MNLFKVKNAGLALLTACMAASFVSCSDDDDKEVKIQGKDMWGEVLRGDNMTLQFFPDHFAYYWEYTYDAASDPDMGLVIEGEFPDARFLSYNVYDDDEQTSYCERGFSLMDVEINAEPGYENPFVTASGKKNQKYTIYVLPTDAASTVSAGKDNIIWFDSDVKKVCTILRYYIPQPDIKGGVEMPLVKGINAKTGELTDAPKRELSGLRGQMEIPGGAFNPSANVMFFRAPFSYAYPNGPAEYCYTRNALEENEVILFNFKAPSYPKSAAEFKTADMRYWSVCVGNSQTYTPLAISDYQTKIDADGFANYILADKNSPDYANVKAIAEANGYNILEWDGKAWDKGVMVLYRNMVFADDYPHSLRQLTPVDGTVSVQDIMANLQKYLCVAALGQWGATGAKVTTAQFIAADGKINLRQPRN